MRQRRIRGLLSDADARALVLAGTHRELREIAATTCSHGNLLAGPCVVCGRLTPEPDGDGG